MPTDVLNVNPDTICNIISYAKAFQAKDVSPYEEKIADTEYEYDSWQVLADHADDQTYNEIKRMIEDLEPDQQIDLLTLMYVGRGDYDVEEWSQAHKEARANIQPNLAGYMMAKPQIAEYLERGLELLGYSCTYAG